MNKSLIYQWVAWSTILGLGLPIQAYSDMTHTTYETMQAAPKTPKQPQKYRRNKPKSGWLALTYVPPKPEKATPSTRMTVGGTRSTSVDFPVVTLLVPEHVGITHRPQPNLYWHLSKVTDRSMIITVMDPNQMEPLLETTRLPPIAAGIHSIDLNEQGKSLLPDRIYEWSVSVLSNADQASSDDLMARGFIEMHPPSTAFTQQISQALPLQQAQLYAGNGAWYDALSVLFEPEFDTDTQQVRSHLLQQVQLKKSVYGPGTQLTVNVVSDVDFD